MTRSRRGSPLAVGRRRLSGYAVVARNGVSLYGTTLVTAVLGFAYWWLAARFLSSAEVGQGSAMISGVQLLAMASVMGLATLTLSELARDTSRAQTLLATALAVAATVAVVLSLVTALVLPQVSTVYRELLGGGVRTALFVLAVLVTTCALILDDACIGLLRGELQLRRNTAFAALKLSLVPLAAVIAPVASGSQLVASWTIGVLGSFIFLLPLLRAGAGPRRPDLAVVRSRWRQALQHHWLNLALEIPRLLMPVMAISLLGEVATAALFAAMMLVAFVNAVPIHFSTVLFAIAPGDLSTLRQQIRFTMAVSIAVSLLAPVGFLLLAPQLLAVFHADYVVAVDALRVLGVSTLLWSIKAHFIAVFRVAGRLNAAALLGTLGAVLEVGAAYLGAVLLGLTGMAIGLVAALGVQALVLAPMIVFVLRGSDSHSRPALVDVGGSASSGRG